MKKKIILILILILIIPFCKANAMNYGGCEYSQVSRLKSIVQNINISYKYKILNNSVYFDVTISNLTPEIYIYDLNFNKYYYNNPSEITISDNFGNGVNYGFYSALNECYGISLGKKYIIFPTYNSFYNSDICKGMENFSLCKKWAKVSYNYDELSKIIYDYKNKNDEVEKEEIKIEKSFFDVIVEFYTKYYYFILIPAILIFGIIVIINKRKDKFKI